ncbi:unnamed protein product, partial [Ectocarpus sp. 12 AP-2014]
MEDENPSQESRSDDFLCTVCSQDLSSGVFQVEEHPTVRGVAVCPRCLASLREGLKKRNKGGGVSDSNDGDAADKGDNGGDDETVSETVSDEDICAWCWESEDKKLFLCDGEGCGRAFCDCCLD